MMRKMDTHGKRFEPRMETSLPVHRNTPSIPLPSGLSAPHRLLDSLTTGGKGLAGSGRGVTSDSLPLAGDPGRPLQAGGLSHRPR